ncbi:MAG: PIN domain-containing protein [Deltaproteobacteria bacterium]|nr:PIN domain-containing protein [Deltaproteobacteria bacterium]
MRTLFDTSIIVAALIESHPMHERAFPWFKQAKTKEFDLVVASHTLAELYAVLSALPIKPRISPAVAWRLVHENIETMADIVSLSPAEYSSTIKHMSELGLSGGIIYDALIAKVAQKSRVERLFTLNIEHFRLVWPGGGKILNTP